MEILAIIPQNLRAQEKEQKKLSTDLKKLKSNRKCK